MDDMSDMFLVLLVFIVFTFFLVDTAVSLLNLYYKKSLPKNVENIYDEKKYATQKKYEIVKTWFSINKNTFDTLVLLLVLFMGGFGWWDSVVRNIFASEFVICLAFFGGIFLVKMLLDIPFSYFFTFHIEQKFGFNKMTQRLFVTDTVKSFLMSLILWGVFLSLIFGAYTLFGEYFWIAGWGIAMIVMILILLLYSRVIVPIFNKQTPLEAGKLREAIEVFGKKVGFQLENIFVLDGSMRSSKANAYFSGFGPQKRIVLFDTLIADLTTEEIVAVLAHEIGHYKRKHTLIMLFFSTIQMGILFFVFSLVVHSLWLALALGVMESFHIGLIAFFLVITPLNFILSIFGNILSRKHEYEADAYANTHASWEDLGNALRKIAQTNFANLTPHPVYEFLHYSHPNISKRLSALQEK